VNVVDVQEYPKIQIMEFPGIILKFRSMRAEFEEIYPGITC